jgi:hypothetical protein
MDPKFTEFPDNFSCPYTSAEGTAAYKRFFWQKNQDFAYFQRFSHHFNFLSDLLQPTKFISDMSVSKFEVSIAQPLPKLAMAIRLHLRHKNACQQNFITMKNK